MNALILTLLLTQTGEKVPPIPDPQPAYAEPEPIIEPQTRKTRYMLAQEQAIRENRTLIVFYQCEAVSVPKHAISVRVEYNLPGLDEPGIIVAVPEKGQLWIDRIRPPGTRFDLEEVKASPVPFERKTARPDDHQESAVADGEEDAAGLVAILADMETYTPARKTQISFRRQIGFIEAFPRSRLKREWRVPGGLEHVQGWSSRLYRMPNRRARVYLARQDPSDSVSTVTWQRSYPDGAAFADVLRNAHGKIFEVRIAEKTNGQWDRYVAYKSRRERPAGYVAMASRQCASCHDKAGLTEYGEAANPGGDTVLSEPIDEVESGRTVQGGFGTRL